MATGRPQARRKVDLAKRIDTLRARRAGAGGTPARLIAAAAEGKLVRITTPCAVCATQARTKNSEFFASRGLDWPTVEVAGRAVHRTCAHDAEALVRDVATGQLLISPGGVGRWVSNGRAIPADCAALFAALGLTPALDLAATAAACGVEARDAIERYRARQPAQPSAEALGEMRAAFGANVEIVDIITGRATRL